MYSKYAYIVEEKHCQFIIPGNNIRDDDVVGVVKLDIISTTTKNCVETKPPNDNLRSQHGT